MCTGITAIAGIWTVAPGVVKQVKRLKRRTRTDGQQ
jgi:hypothetical protein